VKIAKPLLLVAFLLCFTGCEEKTHTSDNNSSSLSSENNQSTLAKKSEHFSFHLSDINDVNHTVGIENKNITISGVKEKLIILNFFSTWCPPCQGQIPYLEDLQKKYKGTLFIAGILVNDPSNKEKLQHFFSQYAVHYFVASHGENAAFIKLASKKLELGENFPLPLTILFKNGHYYSHYEGAVPVEILEHDIKKAINKE